MGEIMHDASIALDRISCRVALIAVGGTVAYANHAWELSEAADGRAFLAALADEEQRAAFRAVATGERTRIAFEWDRSADGTSDWTNVEMVHLEGKGALV